MKQFLIAYKIKLIPLFLLIIATTLFFGCTYVQNQPQKTNVFEFSNYELTLINNSSSLPLLSDSNVFSQADATTVQDYMTLRNLLVQFEDSVYLSISSDKNKSSDEIEAQKLDALTPITSFNLPSSNVISMNLTALKETVISKNYTLTLDIENKQLFINDTEYFFTYDTSLFDAVMHSSLIAPNDKLVKIPSVQVQYQNDLILTNQEQHWNTHFYTNRFIQTITPLPLQNNTEAIVFDRPASLSVSWTDTNELPTTCDIQFIPKQPNNNTSDFPPVSYTPKQTNDYKFDFKLPTLPGDYLVEITSTWLPHDESDFGSITDSFYITIDYPETFTLKNTVIEPGDLIVIEGNYLKSLDNYSVETNLISSIPQFKASDSRFFLFIPLMSKYKPGTYSLQIIRNDSKEILSAFEITVSEKEFLIQELSTSTATASIQSTANNDQFTEALTRARANPHPEKLWTGPFVQPVGGRISTEYGVIRYTNGAETGSRHSGIDFANPEGTQVVAAQSGYVCLAEFLNLTGNTLIIDHGLGFYTQYYHLISIDVKAGDFVEAGSPVAKVGSTGFSTGPHLHFTVYYGGIYLNPWKFFENAPF